MRIVGDGKRQQTIASMSPAVTSLAWLARTWRRTTTTSTLIAYTKSEGLIRHSLDALHSQLVHNRYRLTAICRNRPNKSTNGIHAIAMSSKGTHSFLRTIRHTVYMWAYVVCADNKQHMQCVELTFKYADQKHRSISHYPLLRFLRSNGFAPHVSISAPSWQSYTLWAGFHSYCISKKL